MFKISYILNRMDDIEKMIPTYFHENMRKTMFNLMANDINNKYNQIGGVDKKRKGYESIETFEGYKLKVGISVGTNDTIVTIYTLGQENPSACSIIFIANGIATLSNMSHWDKCTYPIITGRGGGTLLLEFILSYLKQNKRKFNINRITLDDISRKSCNNCDDQIHLASLSFLTHNNTWYGKYGFLPYDSVKQRPDKEKLRLYRMNQAILKKIKVKDVKLLKYMEQAIKDHNIKGINLSVLKQSIEQFKTQSLSIFIRALLDTNPSYCCVFAYVAKQIYAELHLYDFYKSDFYLDI